MKRKIILSILASLMLICLGFCLVGCNNHAHTYGNEWSFDETNHWKECTGADGECDAKVAQLEKHTLDSANVCSVCKQLIIKAQLTFTEIKEGENVVAYSVSGATPKETTYVTIPAEHKGKPVTSIGDNVFSNCNNLIGVTLPDSVTSIGSLAFGYCVGLTSITIPNSVTSISSGAFTGCFNLVEVYNLSSLNITKESEDNGSVGYYALDVYNSKDTPSKLSKKDGYIFYENDDNIAYLMGYVGSETDLVLPNNFNNNNYATYKYAFYNSNITSVTIPECVTWINEATFGHCMELKTVTISRGITSIGKRAFEGCESLESIALPDTVAVINDLAFAGCEGLKNVTMPGVTHIADDAFGGCVALTSITLPNTLTSIGDNAFSNCTGLASVTIPENVTSIGIGAFGGCKGLTSVTFQDTENWSVGYGSTTENVTVTDASANVKYLTETYSKNTWEKN